MSQPKSVVDFLEQSLEIAKYTFESEVQQRLREKWNVKSGKDAKNLSKMIFGNIKSDKPKQLSGTPLRPKATHASRRQNNDTRRVPMKRSRHVPCQERGYDRRDRRERVRRAREIPRDEDIRMVVG